MGIDEVLLSSGVKPLGEDFETCSDYEVSVVESRLGVTLPKGYSSFLKKYGASCFGKFVGVAPIEKNSWTSEDGVNEINLFYSARKDSQYGLLTIKDRYVDQLAEDVLPIAEAPGGNQICLSLSGDQVGRVFFWEHDSSTDSLPTLMAESFEDFISGIREINIRPSSSRLIGARFSDDF